MKVPCKVEKETILLNFMKSTRNIIYLWACFAKVFLLIFLVSACGKPVDYLQSMQDHRNEIDAFMQDSDNSPFFAKVESYNGLSYFETSLKYKILAAYLPIGNRQVRDLATSDGKQEAYEEYGYAIFDLDGVTNKLLILRSVSNTTNELFIPFADSSSGNSTYGGGRYMNIVLADSETIELDFNKAYNPYCAYTEAYSCPLPPAANFLAIEILAGEKNYVEKN